MPGDFLGSQRSTAIYQLLAAFLLLTVLVPVFAFIWFLGILGGIVVFLGSLIFGIGMDRDFESGMTHTWGMAVFTWPFDIVWWIVTGHQISGDPGFPWLPDPAMARF